MENEIRDIPYPGCLHKLGYHRGSSNSYELPASVLEPVVVYLEESLRLEREEKALLIMKVKNANFFKRLLYLFGCAL